MGIIPTMALMLMASGAAQERQAVEPQAASADAKEVTAIVVSTDAALKTIAVKKEAMPGDVGTATDMTLPVDDKAIASLKTVKAGDRVKLSLKVDSTSKRESVFAIEKAPARP